MIYRTSKKDDFTVIGNDLIRDTRLSTAAFYLIVFVLHLPDGWEFSLRGLSAVTGLKEGRLTAALKELKKYGYLKVTKENSAEHTGTFKYRYDWYEDASDTSPRKTTPGETTPGETSPGLTSHGEVPSIINTNITSTNRINTNRVSTDRESAPPRKLYGLYRNIPLSDDELRQLREEFPGDWRARIDRISEYCESHGKRYSNCLAVIRSWARQDRAKARPEPKHRRTEAERNDPNYELF